MKTSFYIVAAAILAVSQSPAQSEDRTAFFPLAVGNRWYYRHINGHASLSYERRPIDYDVKWEITGCDHICGRLFYLLVRTSYNFDGSVRHCDSVFVAHADSKLLSLRPGQSRDDCNAISVWIDYSHLGPSTRKYQMSGRMYEETVTIEGDSLLTLSNYMPGWMDSGVQSQYKRGIGRISLLGMIGETRLVRYDLH